MPQNTPLGPDSRLYLVDGSAYIFRAFHALPNLTRKSDGMPVGAISGFCNMLWKVLTDVQDAAEDAVGPPTHFAVVFDYSGHTFRNDLYSEYKANRGAPPEDLVPQFPVIREATRAFGLPCLEQEGYEADDIMATHARLAQEAGATTVIVSSDKDLCQLVTDKIVMFDPMKNKIIDPAAVHEKYGVGPELMIDMQALMGDSTDNIPGVPGIGPKTAAQLLIEFGSMDALLERASEIKQNKRRENLIEFADDARMSRQLVTLDQHTPVPDDPADFGVTDFDHQQLLAFLEEMEFSTLTRRVRDAGGIEAPAPSVTPAATAPAVEAEEYETIFEASRLGEILDEARDTGVLAIDTETTGLNPMTDQLVGICLSTRPGQGVYVPLTHGAEGLDLDDEDVAKQMPMDDAFSLLRPVLADPAILKVGQNLKFDMVVLNRHDLPIISFDDTMLLSYDADCGVHGHGMDELSQLYLDYTPIPFKEIAGTGKKAKTFDQIDIKTATKYAAEDADITLRLHSPLRARIMERNVSSVYETLDRPLVPIIADMEMAGIKVDQKRLSALSTDFAERMARHEAAAREEARTDFNLGSPKQIGEILFGTMGLPGGKKTKTGAWSTDADVLDTLAAEGVPIAREILGYRQMSKLKSTYTDALVEAINPETRRVHTSFSLASTTTGRLSSNDPNLQNIPIRTEDGRKIRTAFVPEKGNVLISADYSQIELRLLAHIANIPALQTAFREGIDIHAMTASEVFGVSLEGMDPMVRRNAKAINFGIIYGISAFGLARQLDISRGEASDYIKGYFAKFPGIRQYMDETVATAKEQGYVSTIFGRRTHTPNISAKNGAQRAFAERQAINAPIQGSAADVVKRAMIRVPGALEHAGLSAKMLLQVHDELVLEAPKSEADDTIAVVTDVMAKATSPALALSVPLVVEAAAGANWDEAH